jgi:hypothetical protein
MTKSLKDYFQYGLAAVLVIGEFVVIGMMIWLLMSKANGAIPLDPILLNIVSGLILGYHSAFMIVVGFYFGSSKGSSEKNELISGQKPKEG